MTTVPPILIWLHLQSVANIPHIFYYPCPSLCVTFAFYAFPHYCYYFSVPAKSLLPSPGSPHPSDSQVSQTHPIWVMADLTLHKTWTSPNYPPSTSSLLKQSFFFLSQSTILNSTFPSSQDPISLLYLFLYT